jgi:succinoglycan biosynthesis protein ExoA
LPTDRKPFVSIIMPALNEERYVSAAIHSVIPCSNEIEFELLVLDGGSTDRTREIARAIAAEDPRVRLIHNDKRIQSAGVNLAAKLADARSRYLLRADCHVGYPQGFVERCMRTLAQQQVASVVVPMRAEGSTCIQRAIAAAQNSRLGNGGSQHRVRGRSGLVEHGHHAAFDREVFLELGGYDEAFTHNEDAEFDKRLIKSGRRIYLDAEAAVTYYPRADFLSLARQYFNHGSGRARTFLKHGGLPGLRQMLPVAALLGCLLSLVLAAVHPAFSAIAAVYVLACITWGIALAVQQRRACVALSGVAALVMHISWGAGFIRTVFGGSRCAT